MILQILFVVTLFLWLLTLIPYPPLRPYAATSNSILAFIAVLLLGLFVFMPALR